MGSSFTPSVVGAFSARNIVGDTTGTAVPAGYIGEVLSASRAYAWVSLTSGVALNVLASPLSLTAGVWCITGAVGLDGSGNTTAFQIACSKTSATIPATAAFTIPVAGEVWVNQTTTSPTAQNPTQILPAVTVSISSTTSFYLVAKCTVSGATTVFGSLSAIRIA